MGDADLLLNQRSTFSVCTGVTAVYLGWVIVAFWVQGKYSKTKYEILMLARTAIVMLFRPA